MTKLLPLILGAALIGCTSTTTHKDGSVTATTLDGDKISTILGLAINAYSIYSGHGATSSQTISTAKADLAGIATLAQAYVGRTPDAAQLSTGAATPAVGAAVQSSLPAVPITQDTVNKLFAASKSIPNK